MSAVLRWFAQDCALCCARSGDEAICAHCETRLPACVVCTPPTSIDSAVAAFDYVFPVDRLIHRFKYGGDLVAGRWLASRLAARVRCLERPQVLVAPPLTSAGLRRRGFNQALEVAKIVGRDAGVRVTRDAFEKIRETPPQQALGRRERRSNLRGAFRCRLALRGEHVAIVDDVVTTGATAEALADALAAAGAGRVSLWALARTPDPAE